MSGRMRKVRATRRVVRSTSKASPSKRSARSRPKVPPRVKTNHARRSTNVRRSQQRIVKRQAARSRALKSQPRPRPVVRPAAKPVKAMPKRPVPPTSGRRGARQVVRPSSRPASQSKSIRRRTSRPAVAGAVAAAGTLIALNAARAHPDISADVSSLQSSLSDLESRSTFSSISADLTNLDSDLNHVLNLLESARDKGYVYQGDLEDIAYQAMDQWQSVRAQVEANLVEQSRSFQSNLASLNPHIQRLNSVLQNPTSAASYLSTAQNQVNQVLWDLDRAESALEGSYDDIETEVHKLNARLTTIHWALDQLGEARFSLEKSEDLLMAVSARWDKEGKDDPEGILYLSNRRLIFERKEKVATKKILFVTTASELVQEVLIDQALDTVAETQARSKGLFGHQDFMDVGFRAGKLGTVVFHLNGQDSEKWVNLIERAKSGQIEDERATGSGLSFTDFAGPLTSADLIALQNEVNELQDETMFQDVRAELAELENEVRSLERDLADLRAKGYAVEKDLEAEIGILAAQWERVESRAEQTLEHQSQLLGQKMESIQAELATLMGLSSNLAAARPQFIRLKSAIASLEAQADAAEDTILDQYDEYADEIESLSTHFDWIEWMLAALSTASFRLLATESGVAATEAVWERPGLEPENGILFLTDQRLLWEDRVGDYELKIAVPLQQVTEVKEETGEEAEFEALTFDFDSSDAPVTKALFQLALPVAEDWLKMVGRARAGDYAQDRAIELDLAEIERVRNAPEQCPNCGAAFTAPVLRGQNEIVCEYCGVTTRL